MDTQTAYVKLKEEMEKTVGRTMESPADFDLLSKHILDRTHDTVSPTTLKRFFGYVSPQCTPRTSTLSILARYVGYDGWNRFLNSDSTESAFVSDRIIRSDALSIGDTVRFSWQPDRLCVVQYLGGNHYQVQYVENGHFSPGDTFDLNFFALHQPLYLHNLNLKNNTGNSDTYVVGYKSGLTSLALQKKK